jgi:hypothetical protein
MRLKSSVLQCFKPDTSMQSRLVLTPVEREARSYASMQSRLGPTRLRVHDQRRERLAGVLTAMTRRSPGFQSDGGDVLPERWFWPSSAIYRYIER